MAGEDFLAIIRQNRDEQRFWADQPPTACPNDGTVLQPCPPSSGNSLYCPMGDYMYPRDWVRPFSLP